MEEKVQVNGTATLHVLKSRCLVAHKHTDATK